MGSSDLTKLDEVMDEFDPHVVVIVKAQEQALDILNVPRLSFRRQIELSDKTKHPLAFKSVPQLQPVANEIGKQRYTDVSKFNNHGLSVGEPPAIEKLVRSLRPEDDYDAGKVSSYFDGTTGKRLVIRVDDVTDLSFGVNGILKLAKTFRFHLSLEVIPYLNKLKDVDLDPFDPLQELIEVSQHGYCHLPRLAVGARQSEFSSNRAVPFERELKWLRSGKAILAQAFPRRFMLGFSPPFDSVPKWIAQAWKQLGGMFISTMEARPHGARIPTVRVPIDLWCWSHNRRRTTGALWGDIANCSNRLGYAGLVIHPQHFQTQNHLDWLQTLFADLSTIGFRTVRQSEMAVFQPAAIVVSPYRNYQSLGPQ
jgi:hypothetical protein